MLLTLLAPQAAAVSGQIVATAPVAVAAINAARGVAGSVSAAAPTPTLTASGTHAASAVAGTLAATAPAPSIIAAGIAFQRGFATARPGRPVAAPRSPGVPAAARIARPPAGARVPPPLPVGAMAAIAPPATASFTGIAA
jgi:hypothetical protein